MKPTFLSVDTFKKKFDVDVIELKRNKETNTLVVLADESIWLRCQQNFPETEGEAKFMFASHDKDGNAILVDGKAVNKEDIKNWCLVKVQPSSESKFESEGFL